ncbi:uncharacterized protein LOC129759440 [Uranotaenia lowii]|uniref:uncharacterized protein LOC129759440 n=1 Tax=Uranotaenia lowii TaxID=190385 RepID=UPI00247A2275|nr:uncharacterized protein LOC129759440 [Uranotaenia lowii]
MIVVELLLLMLAVQHIEGSNYQRYDDPISQAISEKGKNQLNELENKINLPRYGDCWMQSLEHLRNGCQSLTDSIQVDLALHFTDCFLEMSGQERLDCASERTESLKRLCMSEMSDRAFGVYTEFFTQTQNMCFFLQSQRWQRESDRTVERLTVRSREVSDRLEMAGEVQRVVLEHQKEGLRLQTEMLALGNGLASSLNGSQLTLDRLTEDLKNSTKQHEAVLTELFREFYLLHSWIVGRYSFVDRLIFYVGYLVAVMIATSSKRTAESRSFLLINLVASLLLEIILYKFLSSLDNVQVDQMQWTIRRLSVIVALPVFLYFSYRFQDSNTKLLKEIREQNVLIMDKLLRLKIESSDKTSAHSVPTDRMSVSSLNSQRSHFETRVFRSRPLIIHQHQVEIPISLEPELEPETTASDYERQNRSNERRSFSRQTSPIVERTPSSNRSRRDHSQQTTSDSSTSRGSSVRYNLRKKVQP